VELAATAFIVGLLGGVHCVAMCGGIVGALSFHGAGGLRHPGGDGAAAVHPSASIVGPLALHAAYNSGRIASYSLAGAVAGGVGGTAALMQNVLPAQIALAVLANGLLILLGLYLAGTGRVVGALERAGAHLWRHIAPAGKRFLPADTPPRAFAAGAIWGWLPCGLVYSVLATALVSGSASRGALVMLAFGLGTFPNLIAAGLAVDRLRRWFRLPAVRRGAGYLVVALGVWGVLRVPGLFGRIREGILCVTG
jgi:sulfite exporter TauE/SafE